MKWSIYNRIYPIDTYNSALYNYANDKAIFVVNDLVELLSEVNPDYIKSIHSNLYDSLVESHMLVNDDYDEVKAIKGQLSRRLSSSKTLRVTINPTMDCNLKCWYCYECKEAKTQISEQVSSAVLQFIEKNVNSGTECLFLSYFGGEPLLKASRLAIPITKKIKEICETKGCLLNLHFTTNGTLLIPSIADSILDIGVPTSFQIAFDGDRYYHNMAKNISGLGTYDTLLNNIKYVLSLKMKVNIRCNYTATNISSFKNLVKDLAAIGILNNPFLRLSFQRVWQEKMTSELLNNVSDVVRFVSTMGGVGRMEGSGIARSFCYADYCNSYVFNYNGDVFKCTARDFSHSNRIGYLNSDGTIDFSEKILPFSHRFKAQCDGCSLLPICTICAQARIESTSQGCPRTISESDKEHQIRSRFNEIYSNFLIA